jgi:hypothetical protein
MVHVTDPYKTHVLTYNYNNWLIGTQSRAWRKTIEAGPSNNREPYATTQTTTPSSEEPFVRLGLYLHTPSPLHSQLMVVDSEYLRPRLATSMRNDAQTQPSLRRTQYLRMASSTRYLRDTRYRRNPSKRKSAQNLKICPSPKWLTSRASSPLNVLWSELLLS